MEKRNDGGTWRRLPPLNLGQSTGVHTPAVSRHTKGRMFRLRYHILVNFVHHVKAASLEIKHDSDLSCAASLNT